MFLVYDGQLRGQIGEQKHFPFKIFFPRRANRTMQQRLNGLEEADSDALPPAFETEFLGDYGGGKGSVQYHLEAEVEVAGIEVDVATRGVTPALHYRPSAREKHVTPTASTVEQACIVYDDSLTPDSERPHGFRAKAKAMLKDHEPPSYAFDFLWKNMTNCIHPSQQMVFEVAVRTNTERTTATTTPTIVIQECKVTISGYCGVRIVPTFSRPKDDAEMKDIEDEAILFGTVQPDGPFSKESDFTQTVTTHTMPYLPSSFAVEGMSRYYKCCIQVTLQVGSQKVNVKRILPVTVLPPMQQEIPHDLNSVQAGPFQGIQGDEGQLPAYIGGSAAFPL